MKCEHKRVTIATELISAADCASQVSTENMAESVLQD